jgi:hypothetical protein
MNKGVLKLLARAGLVDEWKVDDAWERTGLLRAPCPVHEGSDNKTSFALKGGYWFCNTLKCHEKYGCKVEGLVVALADRFAEPAIRARDARGNPTYTAARKWLERNAGRVRDELADWAGQTSRGHRGGADRPFSCTGERARSSLRTPSAYFQTRGFDPDTLRSYRIGEPVPGGVFNHLMGRAVVPLLGPRMRRPKFLMTLS